MSETGGRLNIKMPSYQYKGPYYEDRTVSRLYYLYNGNLNTYKDVIEIKWDQPVI